MGPCGYYLVQIGDDGEPAYDVTGQPIITDPRPGLYALTNGDPGSLGIQLQETTAGTLVLLPKQARIGVEFGFQRTNTDFETELGRRYVYPRFNRQIRTMVFRLNPSQLLQFFILDQLVGGERDPFFFWPDRDNAATLFYCRKEANLTVKQVDGVQEIGRAHV